MKTPKDEACRIPRPLKVDGRPRANDAVDGNVLSRLRLTAEELDALKRRGTVHVEQRGTRNIGKLRFRCRGRQVVRYIGGAEATRQVQQELAQWQAAYRKTRELQYLTDIARAALRTAKKTLTPYVEQAGYRYHGLAFRRRRDASTNVIEPASPGD